MTDKWDATIQEIAIKHGVVLSKDDPILMLQTMNERLVEETRQAQTVMLTQFREEMEGISSQWRDDANNKAEKILNAALSSSKEAMDKILRQTTSEFTQAMKQLISDSLTEARDLTRQTRKYNHFWLAGSITACLLFLFFYLSNGR
ncbi:TPA: conjugal transfer protein TraM [Legionella pneumophila]|uniref:conjugal transfer protein TraM n=1 Tax=Legionella pneumophila TaxID=446 RepID=UPI0007707DDB|nr:conjugal transfer protein TraM [Legionella pneumophila]CZP46342.1 conjugal transfer protein TraM [Legionella pneumophila]HEH5967059.1 conjugal transfer protein TraM [Legionella pneumophila]HEL8431300.1 conjugal transfer protein TraM [Legionella pneumophila]HEL8483540.1 conjugal transfer protein TraM [Legionella pneumophila]HEL9672964.1 conjugal transfer protein TraM [Legionella pneumophila]